MKTVSLKLPDDLDAKVEALARKRHVPKSQVIREAISSYAVSEMSVLDLMGDLVGCVSGAPDLSQNPKYMEGFGE